MELTREKCTQNLQSQMLENAEGCATMTMNKYISNKFCTTEVFFQYISLHLIKFNPIHMLDYQWNMSND